jgi:hypothetical protein
VFLYPNSPYYGPASVTIQRWDHGNQTILEDPQASTEHDVGSNDSANPGNNDDETPTGGQDIGPPGHPDGDGDANSDESAWDDSVTIGDTIVAPTPPAEACSVLPKTTLTLSPDATHLSTSGWYNSQSGLSNGVQAALTTCDAAHQVASNVDVDHLVYGLSGATTLTDTNASFAGCSTPSATFSITAQGTTAIKYHGVDNENPAKSETEKTANVSIDTVAPTVTCPIPSPIFTLGQAGAQVTALVSDATSGISPPTQTSVSANASTSSVGLKSVTMPAVSDVAANTNSSTACSYSVFYNFSGFFQPVDNRPTLNTVKAGSAVPVKFSLHGNQGLSVLQPGYPRIEPIACPSGVQLDAIDQTVTAGSSSLSYDASSDTYTYTWKTDKAWSGQCGRFNLGLIDGSSRTADFQFTR